MLRPFAMLLAVLTVLALAASGRAQELSTYERATLTRALDARGLELEPAPEGAIITGVDIVTLDVFDETDPVPDFVNVFHTTTRPRVIRRELLLAPGDRYEQRRVDESARNLKSLIQLSLVLIVPVKDRVPGRVRLLVVTKDVWSLRLNSNFQYGAEGLTYVLLNPTEWNLAGLHTNVGGLFILRRSTYSAGFTASQGRILGTRLTGSLSASLVFNRETGKGEGSFGAFSYGLPRYSERQRWSWGTQIAWDQGITRVRASTSEGTSALLPYHREVYTGTWSVTRSFGVVHKLDVSVGAEADRRVYRSQAGPDVSSTLRAWFEREEVPVSDTHVSPFLQLSIYDNRFLKTIELETLGLQEDYRLGPQVLFKVYPASTHVGSSRDFLALYSGLAYTLPLGNGLVRAIATSSIQYARHDRHQTLATAQLRIASPRLGFGRLIADGVLENRYQNYLRSKSAIGGDGRLRGYPAADTEAVGSEDQRGANAAALNAEFRTSAVNILSAQCGLAAFYDLGAAGDRVASMPWKQSLGLGLRILFPQVDRIVFRADWAIPLTPSGQRLPGALFVTFGQAFPMPELGT